MNTGAPASTYLPHIDRFLNSIKAGQSSGSRMLPIPTGPPATQESPMITLASMRDQALANLSQIKEQIAEEMRSRSQSPQQSPLFRNITTSTNVHNIMTPTTEQRPVPS
jgi:hypothetical protein